ncbi:MAG: hypothetical protein P4L48_09935 [Mycobacterium sp.]|nr:hypothetical protein [Mycobacterium sp.]
MHLIPRVIAPICLLLVAGAVSPIEMPAAVAGPLADSGQAMAFYIHNGSQRELTLWDYTTTEADTSGFPQRSDTIAPGKSMVFELPYRKAIQEIKAWIHTHDDDDIDTPAGVVTMQLAPGGTGPGNYWHAMGCWPSQRRDCQPISSPTSPSTNVVTFNS